MAKRVQKVLEEIGIHLEGEAKEELEVDPRRVDTGLLRNSITYALSGESTHIQKYQNDGKDKQGNSVQIVTGSYHGTAPEDPADQQAVYVGTNVEYGIYVHEGTQRMTPNRFLKNAFMRNMNQIKKKIDSEMKSN